MEFIFKKNILGLNIRHLRKQKKLTQADLCDVIGSKPTTLSNWETGFSSPDLETVVQISNYFGISLDNIILVPYEKWGQEKIEIKSEKTFCALCKEKDRTINVLESLVDMLKEKKQNKVS